MTKLKSVNYRNDRSLIRTIECLIIVSNLVTATLATFWKDKREQG